MILKPVSVETAIAHQQAIQDSLYLLHCAQHVTDSMPEDLMIVGDLSALIAKIEKEVIAARVKFEREAPQQDSAPLVAPWRNQPQAEQHEFLPESITIQGRRYVPEAA